MTDWEQFFDEADTDRSGTLSISELVNIIKKDCKSRNQTPPSDKCIYTMMLDIDHDGDGKLTRDEFLLEMVEKPKRAPSVRQMFFDADKDGNGLCRDEVRSLIEGMNSFKDPIAVADAFFDEADVDGSKVITLEEFMYCFMMGQECQ